MILLSGPNIAGNEWKYVKECLDTAWVSSVGAYVTQFENMVAEFTGNKYNLFHGLLYSKNSCMHLFMIRKLHQNK